MLLKVTDKKMDFVTFHPIDNKRLTFSVRKEFIERYPNYLNIPVKKLLSHPIYIQWFFHNPNRPAVVQKKFSFKYMRFIKICQWWEYKQWKDDQSQGQNQVYGGKVIYVPGLFKHDHKEKVINNETIQIVTYESFLYKIIAKVLKKIADK